MPEPRLIRVLLVDDHYIVRMGLATIVNLEQDMKVIAQADDGETALIEFERCQPDVVLMDLRLPGMDGVQCTEHLVARHRARVIVLTTFLADNDVYRVLQAGAKGYLVKNVSSDDLIKAIRTVHAGGRFIPHEVAAILAGRMQSGDLTLREVEVLQLVVAGESNKEIADRLNITGNTVKFHLKSIMAKLHVRDRTEAATLALQRGLVEFASRDNARS